MAPQPGTKTESTQPRPSVLFALGRLVGYVLTAGLAVGIVGAVILLPAYSRLSQAKYEQATQQAQTDDLEALVGAQERMIERLPEDPILTARLLMSQEAAQPGDGVEYSLPSVGPARPPDLIRAERHPRPAPPPDWLARVAQRCSKPSTRRGLLLLAAGALVVALFLFSAPDKYRQTVADDEEGEQF